MLAFSASSPLPYSCNRSTFARCISGPSKRAQVATRVVMMAEEKKNNPLGGLGGLGNIGNIMDAMKKAQEFSSSAKDLQAELKETEIEATVRDGAVKIVLTGQQQPVQVVVSDELASQGGEEVSKAVTECLVAAHAKSLEYMRGKMGSLTSSFGLPSTPPQL